MTNGEKIKALFPDMYQVEQSLEAWDSWWNAEYKEPTIRNCFGCKYATDNHNSGTEECHLCMWENQYTPTTKNDLAQERYQDLIDYFGDKETAKTILEDKKEFKAWLERLRWNVKRVDELARELEQLKETTKNDLGVDCIDRAELLKAIDTWDKFGFEHTGRFIREPKGNYVTYVQYDDMVNCVKGLPSVIPYMSSVTPQPSDDAISRKAVLEMAKSYNTDGWDMYTPLVVDVEDIKELPSVTPQPRKGHWIADVDKWGDVVTTVNGYRCDKCNTFNADKDNYCPNCGADMREVEE